MLILIILQVQRGHKTNSERLSDFCDGSYFSSHSVFGTHGGALQILFYYDDMEMCNPLGAHTKKHKLGTIAYILQCTLVNITLLIGAFYATCIQSIVQS